MPYRIVAALEDKTLLASLGWLPQILERIAAGADLTETGRGVSETLLVELPCKLVEVRCRKGPSTTVLHAAGEPALPPDIGLTVPTAAPDIHLRVVFVREEEERAWEPFVRAIALLIGLGAEAKLTTREAEPGMRLDAIIRAVEEREIRKSLESCGGDVIAAAASLGVPRSTFYRKMKSLGISAGNAEDEVHPRD